MFAATAANDRLKQAGTSSQTLVAVLSQIRIYAATKKATELPDDPQLAFCYDILNKVSRRQVPMLASSFCTSECTMLLTLLAQSAVSQLLCSFAVVIQQLPNPLRDAICVFYLVLRGLDTVEDDMAIPERIKIPALLSFHEKIYEK